MKNLGAMGGVVIWMRFPRTALRRSDFVSLDESFVRIGYRLPTAVGILQLLPTGSPVESVRRDLDCRWTVKDATELGFIYMDASSEEDAPSARNLGGDDAELFLQTQVIYPRNNEPDVGCVVRIVTGMHGRDFLRSDDGVLPDGGGRLLNRFLDLQDAIWDLHRQLGVSRTECRPWIVCDHVIFRFDGTKQTVRVEESRAVSDKR